MRRDKNGVDWLKESDCESVRDLTVRGTKKVCSMLHFGDDTKITRDNWTENGEARRPGE